RLAILALAACSQDKIEVAKGPTIDYNHAALLSAVDRFVTSGRSPASYGELARTVISLRPGMDKTVAQEAGRRMLVLALPPVQSVQALSMIEQRDALALTVWPTLLTPPIEADALLVVRDPKTPELVPKPGEGPETYIVRLCGGPLADQCKHVV